MADARRSPEGTARHRAKTKERHRKRRLSPEYRAKEALKSRERYLKNRERVLAVANKWQEQNREEINEKRRRLRRDNPDFAHERDKRYRQSTIQYALARVRDGSMGLSELNQRLNRALVRVNDRTRKK